MATKVFSWCTQRCLSCCEVPTTVVVCVPMAIVAEETEAPYGVVVGTLIAFRASTIHDSCGACGYVYTISYDDSQLAEGYELSQQYVNDVICDKCLISFVLNTVDMGITCADVPNCQEPLLVEDTESVDLSINPTIVQTLRADVNISADPGNLIIINPDGLYAAAPTVSAWELLGNAGTVLGVNFIGTTDNVGHDVRVNNLRARRTMPDATAPQIIDGAPSNAVTAGLAGCSILSGESNSIETAGRSAVICGGRLNEINPDAPGTTTRGMSFIGGGYDNYVSLINTPWSAVLNFAGQQVVCGGFNNGIDDAGDNSFIGGGVFNAIWGFGLSTKVVTDYAYADSIVGGEGNSIYIILADNADPTRPEILGLNFIGGGHSNQLDAGYASNIIGGYDHTQGDVQALYNYYSYPTPTNVNGPWTANTIVGGQQHWMCYSQRGLIGGGYINLLYQEDCSAIVSGAFNQIVGTVQPAALNASDMIDSQQPADSNSLANTIVGGLGNTIRNGKCSTILGGALLTIGENSVGYQSSSTRSLATITGGDTDFASFYTSGGNIFPATQVDVSAFPDIAYLGDVDLWIANTDSDARKIKFFEPNADLDFSSTHYTSFEAQAQAANIEYIMPAAQGAVGNVLQVNAAGATSNTLAWTTDASLLGVLTGANFNSTADQAIAINAASYYIEAILVTNASVNLTTADGGVYAAVAKATPLIEAVTDYTALVVASDAQYMSVAITPTFVNFNMSAKVRTESTIYLSLTTAQGAAATADVYVYGKRLS